MFRPEWLQSRRVPIYVLAYLSDGKEPKHDTKIIDDPELSWHRNLKIVVDTGELRSSGELGRHPDPEKQGEAHGVTLIDFDDLAEYAKTVSFDRTRLTNVLRLWKAVLDGAPQDELEEIFDASRTEPDLQPKEAGVGLRTKLKLWLEGRDKTPVLTKDQCLKAARIEFCTTAITENMFKEVWREARLPETWRQQGRRPGT